MDGFSLIKFDGKATEKLLDVISKAVGTIYKPRAIRKEADARAYEIEVTEAAKAKALANKQEIEQDMLDRIQERIQTREIMKQMNIDDVVLIAAEELKNESNISDEPVDKDWTVRFFNIVEDVSDEQMKYLWGKILAGEVKRPNSFSLHTLEVLRNLSKAEADLFAKAATLFIQYNQSIIIYKSDNLRNFNLSFDERFMLTELGLIQADTHIGIVYSKEVGGEVTFVSGKYVIKMTKKKMTLDYSIPILKLTRVGEELAKLLTTVANVEYIKEFCLNQKKQGLIVEYALVIRNDEDVMEHTLPWNLFDGNLHEVVTVT